MICIDLFSGAGGLSCGLNMAGFKPVFANELIKEHAETYKLNHQHTDVFVGDIRELSETFLRKSLKLEKGELDLLAGGPPCQGFSINAPVRAMSDMRNHLFKDFLRMVKEFLPKAVLIENVPGIVSLEKGVVVRDIYKSLQSLGYTVSHKILFAGHYGVPQTRFRTIFIGLRDGGEINFPSPTHNATAVANFAGSKDLCIQIMPLFANSLLKPITVCDAIYDLPRINRAGCLLDPIAYESEVLCEYQAEMRLNSNLIYNHHCNSLGKINLERASYIPKGGNWTHIPYELLPKGMQRARRSDHTKRYGRLHPDGMCSTILTKCDPHWGAFLHPEEDRVLSVREAARIQSFPDYYHFVGSLQQQYEQVGNAVPPKMAKAIGLVLKERLEDIFYA